VKRFIFVLLCCLLIPWLVEAKEKEINLEYKPRDKVTVNPKDVPVMKIYFEEVKDIRSNPREIGENQENKDKKIQIVTSEDNGARKFVLSVLKNEFKDKGFKIEENIDEAQKIIRGTLIKFWTVEESRYNSETQLRIEVKDKTGGVYFNRTFSGEGTNRGRSLSEVNYQESFSNAVARVMDKIFSDAEFLKMLSEKPKPPRVEEKQLGDKKAEEKSLEEKKVEDKRVETPKKVKQPPPPPPAPPIKTQPTGPVFGPK
jgi:hypothetical protein